MRPVAPRVYYGEEITVAEHQEEYMPITVAVIDIADQPRARILLTRWTFTPAERAAVAAGEDVYVSQTGAKGTGMTPMMVYCGPGDFATPTDPAAQPA